MKSQTVILILICLFSVILGGELVASGPTFKLGEAARQKITDCELELKRTETCEIIAIKRTNPDE